MNDSVLLRPEEPIQLAWSDLLVAVGPHRVMGPHPDEVCGITLDSRQVHPGDLYVALPGTRSHGARFADQARRAGAVAILTDAQGVSLMAGQGADSDDQGTNRAGAPGASGGDLAVIVVDDPRSAMAAAAARIFGDPSRSMTMFGITGTNGKTTTAFLVEAGLRAARRHPGTIGTIGYRIDGAELPSGRTTVTTPESPDLQALLRVMADRGATDVVMEVSSHALALHRVDATVFDVAAFTNLGRDHLDFHKTLDNYFEAKARLFTPQLARTAVINVDDPRGQELARRCAENGVQVVSTSVTTQSDYQVVSWTPDAQLGSRVEVRTPSGMRTMRLGIPGEYNVRNAVMALAMLEASGLSFDEVVDGLQDAQVPGRMERVPLGEGAPGVLVDFAHTPQAISSALAGAREGIQHNGSAGRVICVVGAGGDRDAAKRAPMGQAAAEEADVVVVTDDNPRTEDPASIRAAVVAGAQQVGSAEVINGGSRREAIRRALELATPRDLVCLLGKGHETGQQVGEEILPFDDRTVAAEQWAHLSSDEHSGDVA